MNTAERAEKQGGRGRTILKAAIVAAVVTVTVFLLAAVFHERPDGKPHKPSFEPCVFTKIAQVDANAPWVVWPDGEPVPDNTDEEADDDSPDTWLGRYSPNTEVVYEEKLKKAGFETQVLGESLVGFKENLLLFLQYDFMKSQHVLYAYEGKAVPEGGCSPEEAAKILYEDKYGKALTGPSLSWLSYRTPGLTDVTPDGMFEKTGAQVFFNIDIPFTSSGMVFANRRYYVVRYGHSHEWSEGSSLAFADLTGDGDPEMCIIEHNGSSAPADKFIVSTKPGSDGEKREYIRALFPHDYQSGDADFTGRPVFSVKDGTLIVTRGDSREYELSVVDGELRITDRESGRVLP